MELFFAYAAETTFTSGDKLLFIYDDRLGDESYGQLSESLVEWTAGNRYSNEYLAKTFEEKNLSLDELPDEDSFDLETDPWFVNDDGFILFNLHAKGHGLVLNGESFNAPDEIRHLGKKKEGVSFSGLIPVNIDDVQEGDVLVFESINFQTVEQITFEASDSNSLKYSSSIYLVVGSYIRGFQDVILHGKRPNQHEKEH